MSSRATNLRDGTIEIQTDEGDRLILSPDEAQIFHAEIQNNLLQIYSEDQPGLENQIPIVVSEISLSIEDAEQLSARLEYLLNHAGRGPSKGVDWLRVGY